MKQLTRSVLAMALLCGLSGANAAPRPGDATGAERLPVKPGGPIAVEYRAAAEPSVGTPLEIAITARVEARVGNVTIETNPSMPRAVLVTEPEAVVAGADGLYSWTITVVPLAADAGYLSVVVSGQVEGLAQARSVTIPLASGAAESAAPLPQPADGEALIALPVQESP